MPPEPPRIPPPRANGATTPEEIGSPIAPPGRTSRVISPITPPLRAPARLPTASPNARLKKRGLSIGGFARSAFASLAREELQPIRREAESVKERTVEGVEAGESDDELDHFFNSDDDIAPSVARDNVEPVNVDPNHNFDLSDSDMSFSPPPCESRNPLLSLPISKALATHPYNVPSANPTLYFQKTFFTEHGLNLRDDQRVRPTLASYWTWPTAQEIADIAKPDLARKDVRDRRRSVPELPLITMKASSKTTICGVSIRIIKDPRPPHISWKQRATDLVENARKEELALEAERKALEEQMKAHAEKIKMSKNEAAKTVAAGVVIDDADGFVRVKGTRKRQCAGIDLDPGRVRRKYVWKEGKKPLRGRARAAQEAKVAAELEDKRASRESRQQAGFPVSDSEEEEERPEPTTPKTKHCAKKQISLDVQRASASEVIDRTASKRATQQGNKRRIVESSCDFDSDKESEGELIIQTSAVKRAVKPQSSTKRPKNEGLESHSARVGQKEVLVKTPELKSRRTARKMAIVTVVGDKHQSA